MAVNNELKQKMGIERQKTYECICGEGFTDKQFSIQCDFCKEWFHGFCVQIEELIAEEIETFYCEKCVTKTGQSVVYKNETNIHRHNKTELNSTHKPTQSGTKQFIDNLKTQTFIDAKSNETIIKKMRGQQMSFKELLLNGFEIPILVESKEGLELMVPNGDSFTFDSLYDYFSPEYVLDVIDVRRQLNIKMKIKDFVKNLKTDPNERKNVYNCISLEVSSSGLSDKVRPPSIVNKLSWVENYWPRCEQRPAVSKYCLISMQNSFTDFHIDFGGTSVWYHVLKGEKVFYIIKPTKDNVEKYEKWMTCPHSNERLFSNCVDECFKLNLTAGQTLFIPTGWIHAVLTPQDSIVFGGNFLHSLNISLQLDIRQMEQRMKTPDKFQFPFFEMTHWYAAANVQKLLEDSLKHNPPKHLVDGVKALAPQLKLWQKKSKENQNNYLGLTLAPMGVNCTLLVKNLNITLKKADRKQKGLPLVKKRGKSYKSFDLDSNEPSNSAQTKTKCSDKSLPQKKSKNSNTDKTTPLEIDEPSLVVDNTSKAGNKKMRTSSTESESKGSLKLKVSLSGKIVENKEMSSNYDYSFDVSNELSHNSNAAFPSLKSSLSQDIKSDNSSESPKKQKMTKRKQKKEKHDKQMDDEIESMIKGRPEDDDYVYLDLETFDEELKNKPKVKDDSWNPKAKCMIKSTPKPPRPTRDNAKRDVVESSIANAAAKMENMTQPKRAYNRKKPKQPKPSIISEESISTNPILVSEESGSVSSTHVNNPLNINKMSSTKPSTNVTQVNKRPKKGLATAKQRIAKKLKMTTNRIHRIN